VVVLALHSAGVGGAKGQAGLAAIDVRGCYCVTCGRCLSSVVAGQGLSRTRSMSVKPSGRVIHLYRC